MKMGKVTYHGLQYSIEDVPQPTSIITGANLRRPLNEKLDEPSVKQSTTSSDETPDDLQEGEGSSLRNADQE
jgi:hypothetical protein